MAEYSIGDRVQVLLQTELFAAYVTKVHSSGTLDVVYEIDGTNGWSLSKEIHGLTLLLSGALRALPPLRSEPGKEQPSTQPLLQPLPSVGEQPAVKTRTFLYLFFNFEGVDFFAATRPANTLPQPACSLPEDLDGVLPAFTHTHAMSLAPHL